MELFRANAAVGINVDVDGKSLTQWLEPSFWALPRNEHRQMFLDAATLMHGEPQAHLCATWLAHVQLDRGLVYSAARFFVDSLLEELLNSSLVTTDQQYNRCVSA